MGNLLLEEARNVEVEIRPGFLSEVSYLRFAFVADICLAGLPYYNADESLPVHALLLLEYVLFSSYSQHQKHKLMLQSNSGPTGFLRTARERLIRLSDFFADVLLITGSLKKIIALYFSENIFYPFFLMTMHIIFVCSEVLVALVHSIFTITTMWYLAF